MKFRWISLNIRYTENKIRDVFKRWNCLFLHSKSKVWNEFFNIANRDPHSCKCTVEMLTSSCDRNCIQNVKYKILDKALDFLRQTTEYMGSLTRKSPLSLKANFFNGGILRKLDWETAFGIFIFLQKMLSRILNSKSRWIYLF